MRMTEESSGGVGCFPFPCSTSKRVPCFYFDSDSETSSFGSDFATFTIGLPFNVRHLIHVTFDKFKGFIGLPRDLELQVSAPSAGQSVFGVTPDTMQCGHDDYGNNVPTILLLLQRRLYNQGGLHAEGIFRQAAGLQHEEDVRSQLNNGVVPTDIDVHALAGLIKAWFRELPAGVLDGLSHEAVKTVVDSGNDDLAVDLLTTLEETNRHLLDWALNLMVDVVELKETNLMNAHNIATVFAPNLFTISDPHTALIHAGKVMRLLKVLICVKESKRREAESALLRMPGLEVGTEDEPLLDMADLSSETEDVKPPRMERMLSMSRLSLTSLTDDLPAGFINEVDLKLRQSGGLEGVLNFGYDNVICAEDTEDLIVQLAADMASSGQQGFTDAGPVLNSGHDAGSFQEASSLLPEESAVDLSPYAAKDDSAKVE